MRSFAFDALNRLTTETWLTSGTAVNTLSYNYDANSNLLNASNNNGTYTFTYDALDRVSTVAEPFSVSLTFGYDGVSNRTLVQDSFGGVTTSVYDAANNLTSRQFGGTGQTPLRIDFTYNGTNQPATATRYADTLGLVKVGSTTYSYDADNRITAIQHFNALGTSLASFSYSYDAASNVKTQTINGTTTTYSYDALNQLTGDGSNSYSYDATGNRTMAGYSTGTANQLTNDGTWTYSYDAEGNLTKKSKGPSAETWTYGYDHLNHLIWAEDRSTDGGTLIQRLDFKIDVFGNRIEKDVTTSVTVVTRFAQDGWKVHQDAQGNTGDLTGLENWDVFADLNSLNQLHTRYLRSDLVDQIFARIGTGGAAAWYLTDNLGSVRDVTDASGAVQDVIAYDGYGNVTSESNATFGDRFKEAGRELDSETGLYYNRERYYGPGVGRFTSQDPNGLAAGDPNVYRYVYNMPTDATDPSGDYLFATGSNTKGVQQWLVGHGMTQQQGFFLYGLSSQYWFLTIPAGRRGQFNQAVQRYGDPKSVKGILNAAYTAAMNVKVAVVRGKLQIVGTTTLTEKENIEILNWLNGLKGQPGIGDVQLPRTAWKDLKGSIGPETKGVRDFVGGVVDEAVEPVRMGVDVYKAGKFLIQDELGQNPQLPDWWSNLANDMPRDPQKIREYFWEKQKQNLINGAVGVGGYGFAKGIGRGVKYLKQGKVGPKWIRSFSNMARVPGTQYGTKRLDALRKFLDKNNVDLILNSKQNKFVANSIGRHQLHLRPNPTFYEVYHELQHYRHLKAVGYSKFSRTSEKLREQYVYDQLRLSTNLWNNIMSQQERDNAFMYILLKNGNPMATPMRGCPLPDLP